MITNMVMARERLDILGKIIHVIYCDLHKCSNVLQLQSFN